MLKFQIPDVVWGILFGILVTIVLVGSTLKYLPPPLEMFGDDTMDCRQPAIHTKGKAKTGKESTKDNAPLLQDTQTGDHENEPEDKKHEYECLIAKYTGNLAAFTRWLVFATFLLALFGFWQVMVSRNTAKQQLRAYVFVSSAKIVHGIEDDGIPEALVVIKNSGQTPAYRLMSVSALAFNSYPPPPSLTLRVSDPDFLSIAKTRIDLGPGDTTSSATLRKCRLTSAEKASVIDGASAGWVYGEIRYRDAFWRKQSTKYRLIIGGPFGISGGQLTGCEEGNEAT